MSSFLLQEDGASLVTLEDSSGSVLLEESDPIASTTIIGKTGTSGTAVMQKTKSGWTQVTGSTSGTGTPIAQKAVTGFTQVAGH